MSQPSIIVYSSSDVDNVPMLPDDNTWTGTNTFDMGLYSNDIIRATVDGSDAVQIQSSADDYSKLSFGVFTDPTHILEYTYIQSVKSGTGTLLPISFWVGSGVGAVRAWDISTTGDLLAGGDGTGAQNLTTTGTITGSNLSGTNTGDQDLSGYVEFTDLPAQVHETPLKTDYTAGDLDSEAEIISAINATNTTINSIITKLEALGLFEDS